MKTWDGVLILLERASDHNCQRWMCTAR